MKKLHAGLILALAVLLAGVLTTSVLAAESHFRYQNRVVGNVWVAGYHLSGMDSLAATSTLQKAYDDMISKGLTVTVDGNTEIIPLFQTGDRSDVAYNLIEWDPAAIAQEALKIGHNNNVVTDSLLTLYHQAFGHTSIAAAVTTNNDRILEAITTAFPDEQVPTTITDFSVSISRSKGVQIEIIPGSEGKTLDTSSVPETITRDAYNLALSPLELTTIAATPEVTTEEAETLIDAAKTAVAAGPYVLSGIDINGEEQTWEISESTIGNWIVPTKDSEGNPKIGLAAEDMLDFLTDLHVAIDIGAQNARFSIDGGKVTEFQASKTGSVIDDNAVYADLLAALGTDTTDAPIIIATRIDEPSITTDNVNSIGITELLGEATTDFPHSTASRKSNIKHGAEKLNGLLIAPGETASILDPLRPLTLADGYVTELVIRGDEIKPEVGGGLCQLGTTAFRAVMNAGLEVVERRNHSLAISYYNDKTNGNPGTDATLYNPAPDFKFKNDMDTYVLLVTTFDDVKNTITFSFWGTSDGRKGSYAPPTVLTRIPVEAAQYKETADLAPGVEECQNAFPGYTTTFDYTVIYADGTSKVVPFFSSYRALPKICLVGKAVETTESTPETTTTE